MAGHDGKPQLLVVKLAARALALLGDDSTGEVLQDEAVLADILYQFGEERASRRIARAIVAARPVETTLQLVGVVEKCLPRPKPGQSHPATRSFQALRIAVNDEYAELYEGLMAAERALAPGGMLAVVTSIQSRTEWSNGF